MIRGKSWNDGWLTAYWSKKENDLIFGSPCKPDGHFLYGAMSTTYKPDKTFTDELESRGYDITTIQFSVKRKAA